MLFIAISQNHNKRVQGSWQDYGISCLNKDLLLKNTKHNQILIYLPLYIPTYLCVCVSESIKRGIPRKVLQSEEGFAQKSIPLPNSKVFVKIFFWKKYGSEIPNRPTYNLDICPEFCRFLGGHHLFMNLCPCVRV